MSTDESSARYRLVESVYQRALDLPSVQRAAFLEQQCGADSSLHGEVVALLRHYELARNSFLARAVHDIARLPTETSVIPQRIGGYRILGVLGRGGMGIVYEAEQSEPRRHVALKVIRHEFATDGLLRRFRYEVDVLARLRHPGIAQIFESGVGEMISDGSVVSRRPYFAMELVDGAPLHKHVAEQELGTRARMELIARLCDAVQHAHQKGVIHRDLKPSNILVESGGAPKVLDFGVARATDADVSLTTMHTNPEQVVGTLPYMSPEQVAGQVDRLDTRSDVYSLGVLLYELLAGQLPYDTAGKSIAGVARIIHEESPRLLGTVNREFRGDLETIASRALEKDPSRRYVSVHALAADLRRHLNGEPIEARRDSRLYVLGRSLRRHRWAAAAGMAGVLGLAAFATYASVQARRYGDLADKERLQRDVAQTAQAEAEHFATFMEEILAGVSPLVALGRDTQMLDELLDEAATRIQSGEMTRTPRAELRLRLAIGDALLQIAAYERAEEMLTPAPALARATYGDAHVEVARAIGHVALLRDVLGDAEGGLWAHQAALDLRRQLLARDDPAVLNSVNNVANALESLGRFAKALPLLEEVLAASRRTYPDDHPEVALSLNNLAYCLHSLGRLSDALTYYEEALATQQRRFGGDHPYVATGLNNFAGCLQALGRADEALPRFEQALAMRRRLHGGDHPDVANTLNNVAACLRSIGDLPAALERHEEALAMYRSLHPGDHPRVARVLNSTARCLQSLHRYEEARERYAAALAMRRRVYAGDHPDVAISLGNLGGCLVRLGQPAEGLSFHEQAVAMFTRLYPDDHPSRAIALHNLAGCLKRLGRFEEALEPTRNALRMRERLLPPNHPDIIGTRVLVGMLLTELDRFSEAESVLVECATYALEHERAPIRYRRAALNALVALYEVWAEGQPDGERRTMADEWRSRGVRARLIEVADAQGR